MTQETMAYWCAAAALLGLVTYTLLGGADFGGGVWDLFASGPRKQEQRHAIAHALGPVWEANHVWLIFVIVMLFTCFPRAFAAICVGLFIPLHLMLLGIMLRGASFIFRNYSAATSRRAQPLTRYSVVSPRAWGTIFGITSIISPVLLGISFGIVTSGVMRVSATGDVHFASGRTPAWLTPYTVGCGLLALSCCSYLAAVYLVVETRGDLRQDFHRRAIFSGTVTAFLAAIVLVSLKRDATWFAQQLLSFKASPILAIGVVLFVASGVAVFQRRYRLSCVCATSEVAILLIGWGVAYRKFVIYPDVPLLSAAAPAGTLRFILLSLPMGLAILLPSMWMLFRVFKAEHVFMRRQGTRARMKS